MLRDWDIHDKHILVLSSSGKPIFSKHGDEQELVTSFGLVQAVFSIVKESGDTLKCISAGRRKILYFVRGTLYFVGISSTGEPDAVLCKQLEFTYCQILLILTSKVHHVLKNNSSRDLRSLLGADSMKLMKTTNRSDIVAKTIAFDSLEALPMHSILRYKILSHLKYCMEISNAASCLLMCGQKLITHLADPSLGLLFGASDFILLSTLVSSSSSLKSHEQNWVPICLPSFNENAYLQAYVAHFPILDERIIAASFSLVLVSSTSDPESFRILHSARTSFEEEIQRSSVSAEIIHSIVEENSLLGKYLCSFLAVHYFFKLGATQIRNLSNPNAVPAQYISSVWGSTIADEEKSGVYTEYYRNAVRLRRGTCVPEYFSTKSDTENQCTKGVSRRMESYAVRWRHYDTSITRNIPVGNVNKSILSCDEEIICSDDGNQHSVLQLLPLSNHSLVYTCTSNYTVIGLASSDSELHVCFSSILEPLNACNLANNLFYSLKADSDDLFQTANHG